jgi:Tn3 transposase DDE domain
MPAIEMAGFDYVSPVCFPVIEMVSSRPLSARSLPLKTAAPCLPRSWRTGCNLGVYTMTQLNSNVTYEQLKRIGDWHLTEEEQRCALAELSARSRTSTPSARWGQGKTAASDGQRFSLPRRILQQTYSTRFSGFALEFYTFVADNYAPFYSLPIECTDRCVGCLPRLGDH